MGVGVGRGAGGALREGSCVDVRLDSSSGDHVVNRAREVVPGRRDERLLGRYGGPGPDQRSSDQWLHLRVDISRAQALRFVIDWQTGQPPTEASSAPAPIWVEN